MSKSNAGLLSRRTAGIRGEKYPYAVPVSFGAELLNGSVALYFHCARQGRKIDLLKADPHVCIDGDLFAGLEKLSMASLPAMGA